MQEKNLGKDTAYPTFKISGEWWKEKTFPSLNDYLAEIGKHPKSGGRMKERYMTIAISSIRRDLRALRINKPIVIHYHFYEPEKGQRRDVMNVFSFADKVIEDALQKTGTIKGDDPRYVVNTTHDFHYVKGIPYILVELEEITDERC